MVRPLTGIALKSCIDTLRPRIPNACVCDLFAGEGRFGEACLKEGAKRAVFVERDRRQVAAIKRIISKNTAGVVLMADALAYLEKESEPFDIIFADPPFPLWTPEFAHDLTLGVVKRLVPGGIFLVKWPKRMLFSLANEALKPLKSSEFGESRLSYWERHDS